MSIALPLFTAAPLHADVLLGLYCAILLGLAVFGAHRYWLVQRYYKFQRRIPAAPPGKTPLPSVVVQLPVYNERYVAERLVEAVAAMDYPRERWHIQVLDDSTDVTAEMLEAQVKRLRQDGLQIEHVRRADRAGFKAGALACGLERTEAEIIAVFDADFIPRADFLRRTVGHFVDPDVGMVQTRWGNLNEGYNLLTRLQALLLNGHFVMDHGGRSRSGSPFNFNGTAGLWRRAAIEEAGGWRHDTLTEDLDLSYRAQLAGWKFVYRPDVETPAELPVTMAAFKSQQQRWTRGASQTTRKLIGRIWKSDLRAPQKLEATLHLTGNFTYVLMVALALLLLPVYAVRHRYELHWVIWADLPMLVAGTAALGAFYCNAERELGRSPWRALALLPLVMALGMGLSINNAWAAVDGWLRRGGEFVRTPKYRIERTGDGWIGKSYRAGGQRWIAVAEWAMLIYLMATAVFCLANAQWYAVPFLALFIGGFAYVCFSGRRESRAAEGLRVGKSGAQGARA